MAALSSGNIAVVIAGGLGWPVCDAVADVSIVNVLSLKNDRAKAIRYSTLRAICDALECDVGGLLGVSSHT